MLYLYLSDMAPTKYKKIKRTGKTEVLVPEKVGQGVPLDQKKIHSLVLKYRGNLTNVAKAMGASRSAINRICNTNPEMKEVVAEARERLIDEVEDVFIKKIMMGDTHAAMFFLKTRGRERGYDSDYKTDVESITRAAISFALNVSRNPAEG